MRRLTALLDLAAVALIAAFTWFLWEPLPLLACGVATLAASRQLSARGAP